MAVARKIVKLCCQANAELSFAAAAFTTIQSVILAGRVLLRMVAVA
jgi:hypothetical protein